MQIWSLLYRKWVEWLDGLVFGDVWVGGGRYTQSEEL